MVNVLLLSSLFAVAFSAIIPRDDGQLGLSFVGPQAFNNFVTTITNTGTKPLTLLNAPATLNGGLPTNVFDITHASGVTPQFIGMAVKYSIKKAIESGDFTTLDPGQSISVTHDLAGIYKLDQPGQYTLTPKGTFYVVDPSTQEVTAIKADDVPTNSVHVPGNLPAADINKSTAVRKREIIDFKNCASEQKKQITDAAFQATKYVEDARIFLEEMSEDATRYKTWFGAYDEERKSTVEGHFSNISDTALFVTYDCKTCNIANAFAYVYPDQYGTIYLCPLFWNAKVAGSDSMGGTIVHELSHFTANGGTQDYVYGQDGCRQLAVDHPDEAVMNADSHEYFAENNPQ